MNQRDALVAAIGEEDRLLRLCLDRLSRDLRETPGADGELSFKDVLGHIAYWDDFAVRFFRGKLDAIDPAPPSPVCFEERSLAALRRMRTLSFGAVLTRYIEATGSLIAFLDERWDDLTAHEKHGFWVPLRHRRHHRLSLTAAFGLDKGVAGLSGLMEMAEGA